MAENKNWLSQRGHDINDNDYKAVGITEDTIANGNFNREMLDLVHQQNIAGYMKQGMSEQQAKVKADKQRSRAIKMAKANGLKM